MSVGRHQCGPVARSIPVALAPSPPAWEQPMIPRFPAPSQTFTPEPLLQAVAFRGVLKSKSHWVLRTVFFARATFPGV